MSFDPISFSMIKKVTSTMWSTIKQKLETEGAKNKAYDSDVDGVFDVVAIPNLSRSKITDFFDSPFWDNIPDKPTAFPPEAHTHGIGDLTDFVNVSKVIIDTSANRPTAEVAGRLFFETDTHIIWYDNGSEWVKLGVADWDNIDGKPSKFPPEAHASTHTKGGSDELSLDASQITSGVLDLARIPSIPSSKLDFGLAWELVSLIEPTSNVQSISFTGLDGDTDKVYLLIAIVKNTDTDNDRAYQVRFNGDTSVDNYAFIEWRNKEGSASTTYEGLAGGSGSYIVVGYAKAGSVCIIHTIIGAVGVSDASGNVLVPVVSVCSSATAVEICGGIWKKSSNITEIDFIQVAGSYIGSGSKIMLFRLSNV